MHMHGQFCIILDRSHALKNKTVLHSQRQTIEGTVVKLEQHQIYEI